MYVVCVFFSFQPPTTFLGKSICRASFSSRQSSSNSSWSSQSAAEPEMYIVIIYKDNGIFQL
jgi:hypothetical protein